MSSARLGIGFVGSGFITRFHIQSLVGVRDADVRGVWSPNREHAEEAASLARSLGVGDAKAHTSIADMVADPAVEGLWLCGPNHARVENVQAICEAVTSGRGSLRGIACEKPLARTVAEARQVRDLVEQAGLNHGYLENQVFAPSVTRGREIIWRRGAALTGRPYLARAAEEHSGPHTPWFWRGDLQGGGVLNDMMCHSIEVVRHLLTEPGAPRASLRPRRVTAHIASLKWTRPPYPERLQQRMGEDVDYNARPAEDFASATVEYETEDGVGVLGEASTSWSYVGAGLRLTMELLGPEYSMSINTLDSGLKLFFSREVQGRSGEDLVEKQNAEIGLMPVVADEAADYGYQAENRHFVRAFLEDKPPSLTFDAGVEVVEQLMTAYMSAELGRSLDFPPEGLETFVPAVSQRDVESVSMSTSMRLPVAMLCVLNGCWHAAPPSSREPEDFIATAGLPDDLRLELVAREPQIVDPVAVAFDADGRMYVVEMRDYPIQPEGESTPLGRVKLLDDLDGDGYYETATVFAEGLQFPTSALPWRGGILVTRPPDIVFLQDTDGDGAADVEEVLFTGFPVGNTQHNINGLTWGLDNWVYGANGGNNGSAHSVDTPDRDVSIRGMDFRFRPGTGELQQSYETTGGHGIAIDAWGRMFGTHNLDHIQHMVFRPEYLSRSPDLAVGTTREQISDHESSATLYQISPPETRVNHPEQAGRFSGSSGIAYYGGGALPNSYDGTFFVNDVVVNVVHQDVVRPEGPSFRASRGEDEAEFLAGDDNWFRPVTMAVGPDGGLYVVDMHRAVIEHPEWIPDQVEQGLDVRAGDDKGRIYRVVPREGLELTRPELSGADVQTLVEALAHPNKWWRDTAQRLLVERGDESAVPLLRQLSLENDSALGRLHGLWTLEGLGALEPELVQAGLEDASPAVRENALRMAEPYVMASPDVRDAVLRMDSDPDARVRMQVALTVGAIDDPRVSGVLLAILRRDVEYAWSRDAVLTGLAVEPGVALEALLASGDPFVGEVTDGKRDVTRRLASVVGSREDLEPVSSLVSMAGGSQLAPGWRAALLDGLADGLGSGREAAGVEASIRAALEEAINSGFTPVVRGALRVASSFDIQDTGAQDRAMTQARVRVLDTSLSVPERIEEVELLGLGSYPQVGESLLGLMEPRHPLELQIGAARAFARLADNETGGEVLVRWRGYSPQVKGIALDMLLRRVPLHELLISALESGDLNSGELNLDLEQRRRLLRRSSDDIATRAAVFFGDHEFSNRTEIVDQYLTEVPGLRGNESRGQRHFESLCAQCHFLRGVGNPVGPDLGMAFSKGTEDLLTSILDPNSAIAPEYANYLVETTDGVLLNGILRSETPASITLVRAQGETDIVRRSDIREIRTEGLSLMPDGLEQGLEYQDLADLLAFLQLHEH